MKLSGREVAGALARPDRAAPGMLLYGEDPMRVAIRRQDLLAALLGPEAEAEMRLARLTAQELRSDPARLLDAVKAIGMYPGPRAVLVEDATDGLTATLGAALGEWREGDAQIVATAKALPARSKLRKLFEGHARALSLPIFTEPPTRAEIEATLLGAGLEEVGSDAMEVLSGLAAAHGLGDFRQIVEKLALYAWNEAGPVTAEDVLAVAPPTAEAALDDILDAVAGAEAGRIGPLMARLKGQGVGAVPLVLAAQRHFRALYAAATHPQGPGAGLAALRPPVYGPRRDRMAEQIRAWGRDRLEAALGTLVDTDLALRSSSRAPQMAVVERALIRLSMMPRG